MTPLLLLIDFQAGYLRAPRMEPAAGAAVDRAMILLRACRARGIPVAHLRMAAPQGSDVPRLRAGGGLRPQFGSPDYEPPHDLREREDEPVLHKSGHSGFREARLVTLVQNLGIDTILLAGVHMHSCVRHTAIDAREIGLRVWIAEDAVASDDPFQAAATRRYLADRSARFAPVAQLISEFDGAAVSPDEESLHRRIDDVVARAALGAGEWRRTARATRIERVRTLADCVGRSASRLAQTITEDVSKPIRFSKMEARRSVEMLRAIIRHGESLQDVFVAPDTVVRRCPLGVIATITPFNNPLYLALGKIVPAIVFGNSVVWKPAPEAKGVSRLLMDLLSESGWPGDLVVLLEGDGTVGQALLNHPRIDAITITGSSAAGYCAQVAAAARRIPLQAELGGNNAAIVCPDADLVEAAHAIVAGAFDLSGQRCTANRRVVVDHQILDPFLKLLIEATRRLACGSPIDPGTRVGPLVSAARHRFVAGMVSRAEADGWARLVPHGDAPKLDASEADRWYSPTIVVCDDPEHEIVQEETFGPVLVVQSAVGWEAAIGLCNGVRQGLAAAIFTCSTTAVSRFLDEARAGILKVNQSTADAAVDVPFGGWKSSGIGPPEHGIFDIDFFTRPQTVYNPPTETES